MADGGIVGIYRAQTRPESRGWRDVSKSFQKHQAAPDSDVESHAPLARIQMRLHRRRFDWRQRAIGKEEMLVTKGLATHRAGVGLLTLPVHPRPGSDHLLPP